jgi:hypothetical protein
MQRYVGAEPLITVITAQCSAPSGHADTSVITCTALTWYVSTGSLRIISTSCFTVHVLSVSILLSG